MRLGCEAEFVSHLSYVYIGLFENFTSFSQTHVAYEVTWGHSYKLFHLSMEMCPGYADFDAKFLNV